MESVPNEILAQFFSFLDFRDMPHVACVCKRWGDLLKTEAVWMEFSQTHLGEMPPYRGSFKERCRVFCNWKKDVEITTYRQAHIPLNLFHVFTVLEDNSVYEIFSSHESPLSYNVRNLGSSSEMVRIDLNAVEGNNVVAFHLRGTAWTVLDGNGKIFSFDIRTGMCTLKIEGMPFTEMDLNPKIYFNDREIITEYNERITIWNRESRMIELVMDVEKLGTVLTVKSTPHFLFLNILNELNMENRMVAIRKSDQSVVVLDETPVCFCIDTIGTFCALLSREGVVKIYEDVSAQDLVVSRTFAVCPPIANANATLHLANNWVGVLAAGYLHVWDFTVGREVATRAVSNGYSDFCTNGELLVVQEVFLQACKALYYECRLFNFAAGINDSKNNARSLLWGRCNVM